jgi:RNA polymerase sigma factor (sigma-70 family)
MGRCIVYPAQIVDALQHFDGFDASNRVGRTAVYPDHELARLMESSSRRLLRLAYQLCHDAATAQDIVQEALIRVMSSLRRTGAQPASLEAYVRKVIVNEFLRRKRLASSTEIITDSVPEARSGGLDQQVADSDEMWRALATLSPRERAVLVLRYYESLTDHEISEVIACRPATVRSLASRAMKNLRQIDHLSYTR